MQPYLKYFLVFLLPATIVSVDGSLSGTKITLGPKFQKTWELYYENGLEAGFSHESLLKGKLHFGISYVSNRFGSAWGSNALPHDYYQFSPAWHFRPNKIVDPQIQLNLGYYNYDDLGFGGFNNTSMLLGLQFGFQFKVHPKAGSVYLDAGYQLITDADLLFPLFFNFGWRFNLIPGWIS